MHREMLNRYLDYLKQDPKNTRLLLDIAHGYWELGELECALPYLKDLVTQDETNAELIGQLSLLYLDCNDYALAETTAKRALTLNPKNFEGQLVLIFLQLKNERNQGAIIDTLLISHKNEARLWFAKGLTSMLEKDLHAAEKAFENALQLQPNFYDCLIVLSLCQLLQDKSQSALTNYTKAKDLNPKMAAAWGGLAIIHALEKDTSTAKTLIKKGLSLNKHCFYSQLAASYIK
jgi:tetratricopeptide (TPR) repeat protein